MPQSLEATRAAVLELLALRPCHITGLHTPEHHLVSTCTDQKARMLDELLAVLGIDLADVPHRLHDDCYWCHSVPGQEVFRERLRQTHRWAGVEVSPKLAALADDAPRPGDTDLVLACFTDGWQPWLDVLNVAEHRTGLNRTRISATYDPLLKSGAIEERRSGPGSPDVRLHQVTQHA